MSKQANYPQNQPYTGQPVNYIQTTVYVGSEDPGCCGPKGRCQWVGGFNLVVGLINLINGSVTATDPSYYAHLLGVQKVYWQALAGLTITSGLLLIGAAIFLGVGLAKRNPSLLTGWLGIITVYIITAISTLGVNIWIVTTALNSTILVPFTVASGVIFILIQALCIMAIVRYRRSLY